MVSTVRLPHDVFTSVRTEEAEKLSDLAQGRWLEVGSWVGFSAIVLAQGGADEVWAVDWHKGDAHASYQDTLPEFWKNLGKYKLRDKVTLLVGDADTVLPRLLPDQFDGAFIDGFHTFEACRRNLLDVIPLVRHDGVIAIHDYGDERFGVTDAVDQTILEDDRIEWVSLTTTLVVLKRL